MNIPPRTAQLRLLALPACLCTLVLCAPVVAQESLPNAPLPNASRTNAPQTLAALEHARTQFRRDWNYGYPTKLRQISNRITLSKAQIASLKRQIAEYERFPRSPFFYTLEYLRLDLLNAELELQQLQYDLVYVQFEVRDEIRARRRQLQEAAAKLERIR